GSISPRPFCPRMEHEMTQQDTPAAFTDDDLVIFERDGTPSLPTPRHAGRITHDGADIWYVSIGQGQPVILLHGGLGHSGNWNHQVAALVASGYRAVLVDSRGHGRSTRD